MNGFAFLLALTTAGVDFGWTPAKDGGVEYIIQIEPALVQALLEGQEISSTIDPRVQQVRSFRIRVGEAELPQDDGSSQQQPAATTNQPAAADERRAAEAAWDLPQVPALPKRDSLQTSTPIASDAEEQSAERLDDKLPQRPASSGRLPAWAAPAAETETELEPSLDSEVDTNDSQAGRQHVRPLEMRPLQPPTSIYGDPPDAPTWDRDALDAPSTPAPPSADPRPQLAERERTGQEPGRIHRQADYTEVTPSDVAAAPSAKHPARETHQRPAASPHQPKTDVAPSDSGETQKPWMPLVLTSLALFASLGGNGYLAWVAWGIYGRYRVVLAQLREQPSG